MVTDRLLSFLDKLERLRKLAAAHRYAEWEEAKHPRKPKGDPAGGQFAPGEGGGSASTGGNALSVSTPEFKTWFKGSKVVDDKGEPLVVYHGSGQEIESFRGFTNWFSETPERAEEYGELRGAIDNLDPVVFPVYLKAESPFDANTLPKGSTTIGRFFNEMLEQRGGGKVLPKETLSKLKGLMDIVRRGAQTEESGPYYSSHSFWHKPNELFGNDGAAALKRAFLTLGYDSIVVNEEGHKTIGVFDSTQIKSKFNRGTWDTKDPRISYSRREVYARPTAGSGYCMALMGFDFADQAELDRMRDEFAVHLADNGVDDAKAEVAKLEHSWEFAVYANNSLGKSFMSNGHGWLGRLDLSEGSTGLRLFEKYRELATKRYDAYEPKLHDPLTPAERRVDFAAIKASLDHGEAAMKADLAKPIKDAMESLLGLVRRQGEQGMTPQFAESLRIDVGKEFSTALQGHLMDVWRKNRDVAVAELPEALQERLRALKRYGEWNEGDHPREPAGSETGGQFAPNEDGASRSSKIIAVTQSDGRLTRETFNEALPNDEIIVYHGTHGRLLNSIREHGLISNKGRTEGTPVHASRGIYVTPSVDAAYSFGYDSVVAIRVRKKDLLIDHVDSDATTIEQSLFDENAAILKQKRISPEHIVYIVEPTPPSRFFPVMVAGTDQYIVFDGRRQLPTKYPTFEEAKSAADKLNRPGTWNPKDPRISYSREYADWDESKHPRKPKGDTAGGQFAPDRRDHATVFQAPAIQNYLASRSQAIKGIVDEDLTKKARMAIFNAIKSGHPLEETMGDLRRIFEPWIGTDAVEPSGRTQTEEDILQPYRLENVARTETDGAMSAARESVADAAGEYIIGYELSPILDERTSLTCQLVEKYNLSFPKDSPYAQRLIPPLHYNCRTVPIFVTTDDEPVEWSSEEDIQRVLDAIPEGFK